MKFFVLNKQLFIILVVAFILRFWAIWWGFPLFLHLDEGTLINLALRMIETGDFNPHFFRYPTLYIYFIYLNILFCKTFLLTDLAKNREVIYLVCRLSTAIFSTLTVYLTFIIGKSFFSKRTGLLSSLVFSVLFLPVYLSRFITVDMLSLVFLLLSLIFCLQIYSDGKLRSYIYAGIFCGLLFGTKYNFLPFIILLLSWFLSLKTSCQRSLSYLAFSFLAAGAVFLLTNPFFILDFKNYLPGIISQASLLKGEEVASMSDKNGLSSWLWYLKYWFSSGVGIPLFISTLLGTILVVIGRRKLSKEHLILFAFPFIYLIIIFLSHHRGDRYSLPLMPFFAILSGLFLSFSLDLLAKSVKRLKVKLVLSSIFLLVFIGPAVYKAVIFDFIIGQKDTRVQAAEWIVENMPTDQLILTDGATIFTGNYLQSKGFTNVVNGVPFNNKAIFMYPGETILIASWNYREAKNYRPVGEYEEIYGNYNLIINKGKLVKEFSQPQFKNEFFALADLEHSSTVNAYHNPIVQIFEIPEILEGKDYLVKEYFAQNVVKASLAETVADKETASGKVWLIYPQGEIIAVFNAVVSKGRYKAIYRLKSEKSLSEIIIATLEIIGAGDKILAQKTVRGSGFPSSGKYYNFEIPFSLGKGSILEARVSCPVESKLWIEGVKVVRINNQLNE